MPAQPDPHFPGPVALGRGVVVAPDAAPPDGFPSDAPRITIDEQVLAHPSPAVARLHLAWVRREPVVIDLRADNDAMRAPDTDDTDPWRLPHGFTFERERLHFLTWANTYDARSGEPIWWHGELARRRGGDPSDVADVCIDGTHAWADGGPRGPVRPAPGTPATHQLDGVGLVHRESIQLGRLRLLGDPAATDTTRGLADDQRAAVTHPAGPARIIAPAGSGKTRVLTARMRHLVDTLGFEPELVTAVAYNTRAADEMRMRLGTSSRRSVRTFHSLGKWICDLEQRREVIDERQQRSILDRLVRTARIPNTDPFQAYLDALALVRLGLVDPITAGTMLELDEFDETFRDYRAELDRRGWIDFDEMVFHALELLATRPDIRAQVAQRCTHLLVDEFQDLTPAFHLLVRLAASPGLEVFAVGDDDQVIYGYAGADPGYLIDFARDFPGAGDHPLTTNWRCPPRVVDQVATLLGHNRRRVDKVIHAGRAPHTDGAATTSTQPGGEMGATSNGETPTGSPVHAVVATPGSSDPPTDAEPTTPPATTTTTSSATRSTAATSVATASNEAARTNGVALHDVSAGAMAARTIQVIADHMSAGVAPGDIAVLARVNATLLPVQVSLAIAGVPHTKVLDPTVLQRTGIRTALAYLRLGLDPERMTRVDVMETLNRPSRKVKSAVRDHLRGRRFSMQQLAAISEVLSATHAQRWDDYLADIQVLSDAITDGASTVACLDLIRSRIGLGEAMATLDSSRTRPEGSSHGDDLDALSQLALLQDQPVDFEPWLREQLQLPGDDSGVTLSTVHRVKGMEWDHVVVYAANDGLMPHRLAEDVEEERRVFHVALTRCRESVAVVTDRTAQSGFLGNLTATSATAARSAGAAPDCRDPSVAKGVVAADPGVEVVTPGGVTATIRTSDRSGKRVELDVDTAAAWLDRAAPVLVDGEAVTLGPPTPKRARRGSTDQSRDDHAGGGRLEAWRRQRQDRGTGARSIGRSDDTDRTDDGPILDEVGQARFDALRSWRTEQARELALPAYIVFNDKALTAIAAANPTTLTELARCHGVGPTKLDRWGDDVLGVLDGVA